MQTFFVFNLSKCCCIAHDTEIPAGVNNRLHIQNHSCLSTSLPIPTLFSHYFNNCVIPVPSFFFTVVAAVYL